jgi:Mn2+/Fe2+ NRAMP family transporter
MDDGSHLPVDAVIQAISARIGRTTGLGIAGNLRRHHGRWLLYALVGGLTFANVCNIGADLAAMAEASRLLYVAVLKYCGAAAHCSGRL